MRITGGTARGIQLKAPKGDRTRPATDRTREAIFSSIGPAIEGSVCVDLFAGTGSYGFEALSRGAEQCFFLESNLEAIQCLKNNQQSVSKSAGLASYQSKILKVNLMDPAKSFSDLIKTKADYLFLDPPYNLLREHLSYFIDGLSFQLARSSCRLILECPSDLKIKSSIWSVHKQIGAKGRGKPSVILLNLNA